jgi:heavy metal translocating P-type ATPase
VQALIESTELYRLLPGRLRITIDGLRKNKTFAADLVKTLQGIEGIKSASASPQTGRALIYFDDEKISFAGLRQEIAKGQYNFLQREDRLLRHPPLDIKATESAITANASNKSRSLPDCRLKAPIFYAMATGSVLAVLLAKRFFMGRSPFASSQQVFNVAAITTLLSGYPVLRDGLDQFARKKQVNSDLLFFIATLALLAMRESITGLSIMWIVHLSNLFRHIMQARSRAAIEQMLVHKQQLAWRCNAGGHEGVSVEDIVVGDIIVVHPRERVVVDGEIVGGKATINQAAISGEPLPCGKCKGDDVLAGSLVEAGCIKVRAVRVGPDTSIARIVRLVQNASQQRAMVQRDEAYYTNELIPWSIRIAAVVFLLTRDVVRTLAVLLAGCPVAVALSRYSALGAAIANAARHGIYVKDGKTFDEAGRADIVVFDKTGTLTNARPQITEIITLNRSISDTVLLEYAAAADRSTSHPLARMLVDEVKNRELTLLPADSEYVIGHGVRAVVNRQVRITLGNEELMKLDKVDIRRGKAHALRLQHLGSSVLYVAVNGMLRGLIGIRDTLRPEARETIECLRMAGIEEIGILTGDLAYSAQAVANDLGIDKYWGARSPDEKVGIVQELRQGGHNVVMVGDGINDSPALVQANTGIAMGTEEMDLVLESADVVIAGDNLRKVAQMIVISKKTGEVVKQNLAFSAGLSAIGIALAAARFISPITAALLLNVSTLGVVLNSARLLNIRQQLARKLPELDRQ